MKFLQQINQWLDDKVNPIVIKELRQAVQGRFLVWVLLGFLLLQMILLGGNLLTVEVSSSSWISSRAGEQYFVLLLGILSATCLMFVPILTGLRMASERSEHNADLLYISTLSPRSIISGKFLASMLLTILIFSACAPFMTISYLMRGIDVYTIAVCIVIALTAMALSIQLAIFAACIPVSRFFRSVIGLAVLGALFFMFIMVMGSSSEILRRGFMYTIWRSSFGWVVGSFAIAALAAFGLMFVLSISLITAPSANRALPVRIFLTLLFVVCQIYSLVAAYVTKSYQPLLMWDIFGAFILSGVMLFTLNERETLGFRVKKAIPSNGLMRMLSYPFFTGAGSGFVWCLSAAGIMFLCTVIVIVTTSRWSHWHQMDREMFLPLGVFLFGLSYTVTGYAIRRGFFKKLSSGYTWAIALIVFAASGIIPMLVAFLTGMFPRLQDGTLVFTPFVLSSYKHKSTSLGIAVVWGVLCLIYMIPLLVKKYRDFVPAVLESADEAGVS